MLRKQLLCLIEKLHLLLTEIELTSYHTFLGSIITGDGYDHKEINIRLSTGWMAMTILEKIMKDRNVKKSTKIKIAETIIFLSDIRKRQLNSAEK
jgi:hypothetical protein